MPQESELSTRIIYHTNLIGRFVWLCPQKYCQYAPTVGMLDQPKWERVGGGVGEEWKSGREKRRGVVLVGTTSAGGMKSLLGV